MSAASRSRAATAAQILGDNTILWKGKLEDDVDEVARAAHARHSGAAGILLPRQLRCPDLEREPSNTYPVTAQIGEPIMITPAGNNLRDLFLIRRTQRFR